jgi:hypothetical protein
MKTDEQIRRHVMRRVYALYYARLLKKPATRLGAVGALGAVIASSVSVTSVAMNAFAVGGLAQLATFIAVAFVGTSLVVQASVLALVGMVGWFAFDAVKRVETYVVGRHAHALAQ